MSSRATRARNRTSLPTAVGNSTTIVAVTSSKQQSVDQRDSQVCHRRSPGRVSFPLLHATHVLEKEDATTKLFDDDEWSRSVTVTQPVTADIPEERMTCAALKWRTSWRTKGRPLERFDPLIRRKFFSHTTRSWLVRRAEAPAMFDQLIFDEWATRTLNTPLARIKVAERIVLE